MTMFWGAFGILSLLSCVVALWKHCFNNITYAAIMLFQCIAYVKTGWNICAIAVFLTVFALLITE